MQDNPDCQLYLSILTALIAVAVAYIAWNQHVTNRTRLKNELFNRGFNIYEAAISFIRKMQEASTSGDIDMIDEALNWFRSEKLPAVFLLRQECSSYLDTLHDKGVELYRLSLDIRRLEKSLDRMEEHSNVTEKGKGIERELGERKTARNELSIWFSKQLLELNEIFGEDLDLRKKL